MSDLSSLHAVLHARLRDALGEPHCSVGKEKQWSLRPIPLTPAVNILVDGCTEHPVIWVFDPYETNDGVYRTSIIEAGQIDDVVKLIQSRVERARRLRNYLIVS